MNITASMPIGFYRRLHNKVIHRDDIVTVCLPRAIALVGRKRGYLGRGSCPEGSMPLLKQVVALPGDRVVLSTKFIRVNKISYYAPQQSIDDRHQSITHWVKNTTYKDTDSIWLYGSNDPIRSWDSRYFGGVLRSAVHGIYRPLWVLPTTIYTRHLRTGFHFLNPEENPDTVGESHPGKTVSKNSFNLFKNKKIMDYLLYPPSPIFCYTKNFLTSLSQRPTKLSVLETEVRNR